MRKTYWTHRVDDRFYVVEIGFGVNGKYMYVSHCRWVPWDRVEGWVPRG